MGSLSEYHWVYQVITAKVSPHTEIVESCHEAVPQFKEMII